MSQEELQRIKVIDNAVTGRISVREASEYINVSERQIKCGQWARYVGRRSKTFTIVLGPLKLERAYFHCSVCLHGFCPRDQQLGLADSALSPGVTRMVGTVGAMVSFAEGSQLLSELAGLRRRCQTGGTNGRSFGFSHRR